MQQGDVESTAPHISNWLAVRGLSRGIIISEVLVVRHRVDSCIIRVAQDSEIPGAKLDGVLDKLSILQLCWPICNGVTSFASVILLRLWHEKIGSLVKEIGCLFPVWALGRGFYIPRQVTVENLEMVSCIVSVELFPNLLTGSWLSFRSTSL